VARDKNLRPCLPLKPQEKMLKYFYKDILSQKNNTQIAELLGWAFIKIGENYVNEQIVKIVILLK